MFSLGDSVYFIWRGRICWGVIRGINIEVREDSDHHCSYRVEVENTSCLIEMDERDVFKSEEHLALHISKLLIKNKTIFPNITKNRIDNFVKRAKLIKS